MHSPYPVSKPFDEGYIQVSEYTQYTVGWNLLKTVEYKVDYLTAVATCNVGILKGSLVIIFIHGGPGSGAGQENSVFFNPEVFRVFIFSQRGSGKSLPSGEIRENTTWDLVADIEKIRTKFGVEKWLVFGGSWGSTLSLIYAETYPERTVALILRGIYLADDAEMRWFYQTQTKAYFPEEWEEFASIVAPEKRHDVIYAYNELLHHPDKKVREKAAQQWTTYEFSCYKLLQDPDYADKAGQDQYAWSKTVIETHYFLNNCFFEDGHIVSEPQISKIRHIPCKIVNGRYDVVCPPHTAHRLRKAYGDNCEIYWTPDAGHTAMEKGTMVALAKAVDHFAPDKYWEERA